MGAGGGAGVGGGPAGKASAAGQPRVQKEPDVLHRDNAAKRAPRAV